MSGGMGRYVEQLLVDIARATENVDWPYGERARSIHDWISDEEEDKIAPRRQLEEWTGLRKIELPPHERLSDDQVHRVTDALKGMLNAYNWSFVVQTHVPERIEYAAIRENFDQVALVKQWHMGFFQLCRPGTPHGTCALGEHCQCRFYAEIAANFIDEDLTPEEERARELECEITHLKRKHGDDWEKYYPYHLDPKYDDEHGKPYDYGFGEEVEDEDDEWWRGG